MCKSEWGTEHNSVFVTHLIIYTSPQNTQTHSVSDEYLYNCSDLRCTIPVEQFLIGIIMGVVPLQRMFVFIRVCLITSEMKLMNCYSGSHYT